MTKIIVTPGIYARAVEKFGEGKVGEIFQINPDHCNHESFELRVIRKAMEFGGRFKTRVTVETVCLDCREINHGMEFWEAQRRVTEAR